jgi:hypothetical protein
VQIIKAIGFALIGFFLAFGLYYAFEVGYFERWENVPLQSQEVSEYFSTTQKKNVTSSPIEIKRPCDYSLPEFSLLSNSPKNIDDCVQVTMPYPEGESRNTYVRDSNGSIWRWSYLIYFDLTALICVPGSGLLIGVLIAVVTNSPRKPV